MELKLLRDMISGDRPHFRTITTLTPLFLDFSPTSILTWKTVGHATIIAKCKKINRPAIVQDSASPPFTTPIQSTSSTHTVRDAVEHHKERLLTWRGLLPTNLAWQDGQAVDLVPDNYPSQLLVALMGNIQAALLRSHYHHARYLLYRPYVYRVLHHPASLISEDMSGAAECLRASLRWPVTMEPASTSKRLIPLPFYWSQNVCGVLVLLHLSQQHPALSHIRHNFCGRRFEYDASETVELYIHWLRDLKQIDATAERCWGIVQPLYGLED